MVAAALLWSLCAQEEGEKKENITVEWHAAVRDMVYEKSCLQLRAPLRLDPYLLSGGGQAKAKASSQAGGRPAADLKTDKPKEQPASQPAVRPTV